MMVVILAMFAYQGFTQAINGIGAPWLSKDFHLGQSGIATLFAWISISAIGSLALNRMADRVGRRRILLVGIYGTPIVALAAALSFNYVAFVVFEIALYALSNSTLAGSIVMITEEMPIELRARGQGRAGFFFAIGSTGVLIGMPILTGAGYSWRWMLVMSAAAIAASPYLARALPESRRWEHAAQTGATGKNNFYDVFSPAFRGRAIPILICSLLSTIAGVAAGSWPYYHLVSVVGLSAGRASALMLTAGAVGILGFRLGAWMCERVGRVPTVLVNGFALGIAATLFFWGPPRGFAPVELWLGVAWIMLSVTLNIGLVVGNTIGSELFPTVIRGTMMGWYALIGAIAATTAQATIAALAAPMGGLSIVVGMLALLSIPSAIIFRMFIPETRGLSLEQVAGDVAPAG